MKYRLPELDIPANNPFKHDVLERKPLVDFLAGLISRLAGPFVLALDSPWGTGKTTLIRMLKAELELKKFQCVYFNAWQVDYVTDPLVALVSAIDDIHLDVSVAESSFRGHLKTVKKITSAVAKRAVIAGVKAATLGVLDVDEAIETMVSDAAGEMAGNLVDSFKKEKELLEKFRCEIEKAILQLEAAGRKETLVFFIDELDRCRPTFAIEMLERIKHLFDLPNIVFVLSIDKSQLEASTAAVYGERINAPEYLRRFIDLEYGIPVVQTKLFTENLLTRFDLDEVFAERNGSDNRYDKKNFVDIFTDLADISSMTLRARERSITRLCIVLEQTPSNFYLDPVLVALLLVLRLKNPEMFRKLCAGIDGPKDVIEYLASLPKGREMMDAQTGILIEAYLMACDVNSERREARYAEISLQANSENGISPANLRARDLNRMKGFIFSGWRHSISLREIARKIDLAASVRD